jgi:CHAD domain-containing protein
MTHFFQKKLQENLERVNKRLNVYLSDPNNEKNIHGIRTSLRRLDASFSILPKKLRTRNRKQIEQYKEFFRANSKVRDFDVIMCRIAALGAPETIKLGLRKKRKLELERARKLALVVKALKPMHVEYVSTNKLKSRIDKTADKLCSMIMETLPIALSSSAQVEDLHRLRKDCKELRYTFEIIPTGYRKRYEKMATSAIGNASITLEKLQNLLGLIRDSGLTIEYLKSINSKVAKTLAAKEAGKHYQLHREFVKYVKG